jgi:hypothetical protein
VNKIKHDEDTRKRIQAGNIINRLHKLIMGEVEMPPHAVTAALGLLRKTLPDLTSVEHSGEITKTYVARMPSKSADIDEWRKKHAPQPTMQ